MGSKRTQPKRLDESEVRIRIDSIFERSEFERLRQQERGQRVAPTTAKSAATVDRIIMASAELLDITPLRDISTRSVADHSGENIATVYRYFDDLESILVELAFRWQAASLFGIKEMAVKGANTDDREAWVNEMVDIAALFRSNTPGDLCLSRDSSALPKVREVITAAEIAAAEMFAAALDMHSPGRGESFWYPRSLTIIRCVSRCLTDACSQRPADKVQIQMLKELAIAFFSPDLD